MKDSLVQDLQRIGLSEKEAKVYLASLELGPSTAQLIAAKALVNRPTTYLMIESLVKRGLMGSFVKGKKRMFVAEPAEKLSVLHQHEMARLTNLGALVNGLVKEISKAHSDDSRPSVTVFEGTDSVMENYRQEILKNKDKKGAIYSIIGRYGPTSGKKNLSEEFRDFLLTSKKRKITLRTLGLGGVESDYVAQVKKINASWEYKKIESQSAFSGEISIFGNKVLLVPETKKIHSVVIENAPVAQAFRDILNQLWSKI